VGPLQRQPAQAAVERCPKLALKKPSKMLTSSDLNPKELAKRADSLIRHSSNRYLTTVRIAFRAKQRRFDDFDGLLDDSMIKPVQRAIIELSDEQDQPDLLPG
jgi:DNA-directed RNA polymerase subunit omega